MKKRAYRSVRVKEVRITEFELLLAEGPLVVGLDVAKSEVLVVVRDSTGAFQRPWKVQQPAEVGELVSRLVELRRFRPLTVALEPTGTYGDALRQSLGDAGLSVQRVSGKASRDYSEVFDGVPSSHDGKDAAVVAELAAIGKGRSWPTPQVTDWESRLEQWVTWLDGQQDILQLWLGRMEGWLARHWPEACAVWSLNSVTLWRVLAEYGSPGELARRGAEASSEVESPRAQLIRWGGPFLRPAKVDALLESARNTIGVRTTAATSETIRCYATEALAAHGKLHQARRELRDLASQNETVVRLARVLGSATACVLYHTVGDPHDYPSGAAYRKALGLNLKERSSGKYQGHLKITKRGSSLARRWLYFAALRMVQKTGIREWFVAKKHKDQERGNGAVVAVMRKLALALHAVATRGVTFESARLFPGRPCPPQTTVPTVGTTADDASTHDGAHL